MTTTTLPIDLPAPAKPTGTLKRAAIVAILAIGSLIGAGIAISASNQHAKEAQQRETHRAGQVIAGYCPTTVTSDCLARALTGGK